MKRLYTLLLSGLVLAASASVAVPTAMRHIGNAQSAERIGLTQKRVTPLQNARLQAKKLNATGSIKASSIANIGQPRNLDKTYVKSGTSEQVSAFGASSLKSAPAKVKSRAATATPASISELVSLSWDAEYYGMLTSNSGTHSGAAQFVYDEQYQELDLYLPDYSTPFYVGYEDGKLIIYNSVNYGSNTNGDIVLCPISTAGALLNKNNVEIPFNPETGAFEFPSDFAWSLAAVSGGNLIGHYWAARSFKLSVSDGDYTVSATLENEITADNTFKVTIETGADVDKTRGLIVDFDGKTDSYLTYLPSLGQEYVADTYTIDPVNHNDLGEVMTENGYASMMLATYAADGTAKRTTQVAMIVELDSEEGWKNVGEVTYTDQMFSQYYQNFSLSQSATLQESEQTPGLFRLVNPYSSHAKYDKTKNHYLYIDATDKEWVSIPFSVSGLDLAGDGILTFGTCAVLGYTKETGTSSGLTAGTMTDRTVTFPARSLFCHEQHYNEPGSWSYFNSSTAVTFEFPAITLTLTALDADGKPLADATVKLGDAETKTDADGKAVLDVPFETGYFGTITVNVNGKDIDVNLNGAASTATVNPEGGEVTPPADGWTSLGEATIQDGWLLPAFGIDQTKEQNWYTAELQQSNANKNIYRVVDPYKGKSPVASSNQSNKTGYIQFDITDPDHVVFSLVEAGFANADKELTEFYCTDYLSYFINADAGYTLSDLVEMLGEDWPYTTFKDGVLYVNAKGDADGNLIQAARYGNQDKPNDMKTWKDGKGETLNMDSKIIFPAQGAESGFTVYANGEMNKELNLNPWWNVSLDSQAENPAGDGKVLSSTHTGDLTSNFCFGFQTEKGSTVSGPLHSATLSFQYYATTTCTVTVKLTADKEDEKTVTVADDDVNKWNTVTFNITEDFPNVASEWKNWEKQGDGDAVFSAVVQDYNADTKVYFNNVVYTNLDTKWEKPEVEEPFCPVPLTPTKAADDVFSLLSGAYPMKMGYSPNDWGSGTSYEMLLTDNRVPVVRFGRFNYYGWEFYENIDVTGMDYLHVDFYPMTATGFGVTPISPAVDGGAANEKLYTVAAEDVTAGQWNSLDIPLTYFEGVDFSNLFQMKYAGGNSESTVYMTNVYFYKGEPDTPEPGETLDITGDYIGYLNDCYFDDSVGNLEEDVTITQEGTDVTINSDYFLSPIKATIDPATGVITFDNNGFVGTYTYDGTTYYIELTPHRWIYDDYTTGEGHSSFDSYSVTYNPETHTIEFPDDAGFAWRAYRDQALTTYAGFLDAFDVFKFAWVDPNIDPNEGWTSLGEATFQDGWVLPMFGIDQTDRANWYKVEMQQNDENENVYRLVDPYHGNCPVADYNESEKPGYIQFDVTDPDHVVFATDVKSGFAFSAAALPAMYCYNAYTFFTTEFGLTAEEMSESEPDYQFTTYKDGIVTVPSWTNENGLNNEACFSTSTTLNLYEWQDANYVPAYMEAKIFFPGVDSIRELNAKSEAAPEVYYNLHGQRIAKPTVPGLYIRNNQKVVVR